jgi:hypothetical protein
LYALFLGLPPHNINLPTNYPPRQVFSNLRSFRHQLILGLAISDCAMAFNFLLSSSMNVSNRWIGAPEQARFCSFNGYMTQVFVIQTDYWVLIIAVYTYFVLTDQKRWSAWLHAHRILPWALPWVLSVLWASIGLGVTGYGDIGGWCWFTSDEVRLLVCAFSIKLEVFFF